MVDKYYRKIENVENDVENSIQISSILLKLKGYDEKLSDLSKIENNQKSINNNKNDITNNQKSIDNNKNNIKNNKNDINNNKNDITNNKNDINNNKNNINNNENNINNNKDDINNNKNNINNNSVDITNLLSYYKLGKIYIYDIQKGNKFVDKNNYYHIFEKEIIYNFIKGSYFEIISKVLTQISNYNLIGFFEILCNFYNDNNELFYNISLSTAMGSINKLSTIKSVFMVPIDKNMTKIKIDFFIKPKENEKHRSATFTIEDINSNKIYIKYYKKN